MRSRIISSAKNAHPARGVGLIDVAAGRQRRAAVENPDVVQAQEAALKDIVARMVLTVDPPGEVQQHFLEDPFEKDEVGLAAHAFRRS